LFNDDNSQHHVQLRRFPRSQICIPRRIAKWLPSGDAFKIQDLERLEGETLPTYFRHQRFASLIRQLNFYSFRKVNKERNFWVYRHPLFHRDRPDELHLVRRRTCQGVDGRKHRPEFDIASLEKGAASSLDERGAPIKKGATKKAGVATATKSPAVKKAAKKSLKRSGAPVEVTPTPKKKRTSKTFISTPSKLVKNSDDSDSSDDESTVELRTTKSSAPFGEVLMSPRAQMKQNYARQVSVSTASSGTRTPPGRDHILLEAANTSDVDRFEQKEQAMLVNEVSMALEEHMKRAKSAAAASAIGGKKNSAAARRVSVLGTVTPITDTMKYNGLSYDDDIVERDEDVIGIIDKIKVEADQEKESQGMVIDTNMVEIDEASMTGVVTDEYESEDDSTSSFRTTSTKVAMTSLQRSDVFKAIQAAKIQREKVTALGGSAIPIKDMATIGSIGLKLVNSKAYSHDSATIARFCMSTAPSDPTIVSRLMSLLSSSKGIATEFNQYLAALNPNLSADILRGNISKLPKGKLSDTLRGLGVFIVNKLESTVANAEKNKYLGFTNDEKSAIRKTLETWRLNSIGV